MGAILRRGLNYRHPLIMRVLHAEGAVSRLRLRVEAVASGCGALGGEAGARAWAVDSAGAAGTGSWGRGPGDRAGRYDVVVRLQSLVQQRPYDHVVPGRPPGGPGGPVAPVAPAIPVVRAGHAVRRSVTGRDRERGSKPRFCGRVEDPDGTAEAAGGRPEAGRGPARRRGPWSCTICPAATPASGAPPRPPASMTCRRRSPDAPARMMPARRMMPAPPGDAPVS